MILPGKKVCKMERRLRKKKKNKKTSRQKKRIRVKEKSKRIRVKIAPRTRRGPFSKGPTPHWVSSDHVLQGKRR